MRNKKRLVALALATTMVLGSSLTAFAADDGSSTGAGSSEGHVDKKATNVVLPTTEGDTPDVTSTTFAYTMDPERLIVATSHAKYGEAVEFPAAATDTGVYFNNGKKGGEGTDKDNVVYANTSAAQKVTNKSSHSIDLTVKAEAVAGANDIPLVANDEIDDATEASLYLGLKVGSEAAVAVDEETAATKTVSIAGSENNFKIFAKADKSGYEYRALTLEEYKALDGNGEKTQADYDATWKTSTFQLEGAVTEGKEITSTTSAPSIKVTWSWVDPSAGPAATMTSGGLITINNATCTSSQIKMVELTSGTEKYEASAANATYADPADGTITIQLGSGWLESWTGAVVNVKIILADDTEVTAQATFD